MMVSALLTSCVGNQKLLENGDYEKLISRVTKKLAGKKKSDADVMALESGYRRFKTETLRKSDALTSDNSINGWENALTMYRSLDKAQDKIAPLLPLRSQSGRKANIQLIHTDSLLRQVKNHLTDLYYDKLDELKNNAYSGNKLAAREAVHTIHRIGQLSGEKDLVNLKNEMTEIGMNIIWIDIEDNSYSRLPYAVSDKLRLVELKNTGSGWNRFIINPGEDTKPDYKVILTINDIYTEPEYIRTIENKYTKSIEDGWEYVTDARGNVVKDSIGNDIKRPRTVNVSAIVRNEILTKKAVFSGYVEAIDLSTGNTIYSRAIYTEDVFTHAARNFYGDARALDHQLTARIDPIPAPRHTDMLLHVMEKGKWIFMNELNGIRFL